MGQEGFVALGSFVKARLLARPYLAVMAVALLLSLAVCLLFVWKAGGAAWGGDSSRYTQGAEALLKGEPLSGRQPSYIGYIWTLLLIRWVRLPFAAVVALQVVCAVLAAALAARAVSGVAGNRAALAFAGFHALNLKAHRWQAFVLTDGLYISAVLVTASALILAFTSGAKESRRWILLAAIASLGAVFLRPEGLLVPMALVAALLVWKGEGKSWRWLLAGGLAGSSLLCVLLFKGTSASEVDLLGHFLRGTVVWGFPATAVAMPEHTSFHAAGELPRFVEYVANHPGASLALGLRRVVTECNPLRAQFSPLIKTLSAISLGVFLAGMWAAFASRGLGRPLKAFAAALLLMQLGLIAVSFADYDARFITVVSPVLTLYSVLGLASLAVKPLKSEPPIGSHKDPD